MKQPDIFPLPTGKLPANAQVANLVSILAIIIAQNGGELTVTGLSQYDAQGLRIVGNFSEGGDSVTLRTLPLPMPGRDQ